MLVFPIVSFKSDQLFMWRFAGMTLPVANFLVESVFCILDDPTDDPQRIGAPEFGVWIRDLLTLLRSSQLSTHTYTHSPVPSMLSISCHHSPLLRLPVARFPVRPPLLAALPAGHLLSFVLSLNALWIPFLITPVAMARFLLSSISCLVRRTRTKSNNSNSKRRMVSDPFLRPSDGSVGARARA